MHAYAITGFLRQPSEAMAPFNAVLKIPFLIKTDEDYLWLQRRLIKKFIVKDVFIFNLVRLKATMPDVEILSFVAEEIANDRDHGRGE